MEKMQRIIAEISGVYYILERRKGTKVYRQMEINDDEGFPTVHDAEAALKAL